jgi:TPR repeat protein
MKQCIVRNEMPFNRPQNDIAIKLQNLFNGDVLMTDDYSWVNFEEACRLYDLAEYQEALKILENLAQKGFGAAMSRLALMYFNGLGVHRDVDESIKWDLAAIEVGDLTSLGNVALSYCEKREFRTARYWFERAVEMGDGDSALELAKLLHVSDAEVKSVEKLLNFAIGSESTTPDGQEKAKLLRQFIGESVQKY